MLIAVYRTCILWSCFLCHFGCHIDLLGIITIFDMLVYNVTNTIYRSQVFGFDFRSLTHARLSLSARLSVCMFVTFSLWCIFSGCFWHAYARWRAHALFRSSNSIKWLLHVWFIFAIICERCTQLIKLCASERNVAQD